MTLIVAWPDRVLSPNVTASHWRKGRARKVAKEATYYTAIGMKKLSGRTEPIMVKLDAYPKHIRRRGHDNLLASLKGHLDGLALALDVDDNLFRPQLTIHPADGRGVIEISVEAI